MPRRQDPLDPYRGKRDFRKTPEPSGEDAPTAARRGFVIHRHDARRLHYDLRLEAEGVLKSFAIPKGFSFNPRDKHLAVQTEDHPMSYESFEGVIPKGEYGAGPMTIWDSGTYAMRDGGDLSEALAQGEIKFTLDGGRVRGEWHMVKTKRGPKDWLIFKARDVYARGETDPRFPLDLSRDKRQPPAKTLKPMQVGRPAEPFSDDGWLFELKFDGQRLLARVDESGVKWRTGSGRAFKASLEPIERDLRKLRWVQGWIEGVLVALDDNHRPDRALLERRLADGETDELLFHAFDLLHYDHWPLRRLPLRDRKRALVSILPNLKNVLYTDHVLGRGVELFETIESSGLPGVIGKRADAPYKAGPSEDWVAILATDGDEDSGDARSDDLLATLEPSARTTPSKVRFSNLDKIYWPEERITKGQLLAYYDSMADLLLPYLRNRPVHLLRYPDGIQGKFFYHKRVEKLPDWVETTQVREKDGAEVRYVVCNDRDTLLYLVNLGSIDLHPWLSDCTDLDSPNFAVIDLDPSDAEFTKVITLARTVGKILGGAGLEAFLKTSGASGMHIYIPLAPGYTYEQSAMLCEVIARMTVREHKEIATVERSVSRRESRVYVDYLQNRREQTIVPPYIVRPVPGACVSTPLEWDELSFDLRPSMFHISNVPARAHERGDLFRGTLEQPQDLLAAIERLQSQFS